MAIRILTKNAIDNTNIDGARANNFNAGRRSGIVKGVLNEGTLSVLSSNVIALDTCELRICGHRIVIDKTETINLTSSPATTIRYSLIAQIIVDDNSNPQFSLFIQLASTPLIQQNLDKSPTGTGTYQIEIGRFSYNTNAQIVDVVRTVELITGSGQNDYDYINIGEVNTTMVQSGVNAEVDIENVIDEETGEKKTNFNFIIPETAGTSINIAGEQQSTIDFISNPQEQIDNISKNLDNISNPNLLINPDFKINQRGESSYPSNVEKYTVDRWVFKGGTDGSVTPNIGNGMIFVGGSGSSIEQYIETPLQLSTQYTLSVNSPTGTVKTTFTTPSSLPTNITSYAQVIVLASNGAIGAQINVRYVTNGYWGVRIYAYAGQTVTINWVKLEKGEIATPFVAPDIATELSKCQRYFYKARLNINATAASSTSELYPEVFLPVSMRAIPTITFTNFNVRGNGIENNTVTSIESNTFDDNTNFLKLKVVTSTANLVKWQCYSMHNGELSFDAEI